MAEFVLSRVIGRFNFPQIPLKQTWTQLQRNRMERPRCPEQVESIGRLRRVFAQLHEEGRYRQVFILLLAWFFPVFSHGQPQVITADGIRLVSKVENGHIAVYEGGSWRPRFWTGVNLGATTPGHFPGEHSPTKEDYLRWFQQMKEMNVRLVRVYAILSPQFYQALLAFNSNQPQPLRLVQGIWPPEADLLGPGGNGQDAFDSAIVAKFRGEIADAVRVVHGDIVRPARPGYSSGDYRADVSPYLLGWLVGAEWHPLAVKVTNDSHPGAQPFSGLYFRATESASAFEKWLAIMLEQVALEEMRYGWQHPVAFVNWPTTDPLTHRSEPDPRQDLASVDPTHVTSTPAWQAGYYAAYHIYPYYPDFLRYDPKYEVYRDAVGNRNPYAGYLHELRAYHSGIPVVIAEFGVPSSRGLAHRGPLGQDQGMHTEAEQGKINADLLASIYGEAYDGGIIFSWQDEWFKTTWNTLDLEVPQDRRPLWLNRLTNEKFFGMLAVEAGPAGSFIVLDGNTGDWGRTRSRVDGSYAAMDLSVSHDEAYLYLLLRKRGGAWDFLHDVLHIGFQTLPGGSPSADRAPGILFSRPIQFLLQIKGATGSRLYVLSAYDQHTYRWGFVERQVEFDPRYPDPSQRLFLPWKLLLNRSIVLPLTGQRVPAEEAEIGVLRMGTTDPNSPRYDDLADWYAEGDILEVRIPWMMLGFTDPSSALVWNWPYVAGRLEPVRTAGVWLEPRLSIDGTAVPNAAPPLLYSWKLWDLPEYHERTKISYAIMRNGLSGYDLPIGLTEVNPIPVLSSLSPQSAAVGGPTFALTLAGFHFLPYSVVRWNGNNRSTTFVTSSQLTASIPVGDIALAGTAQITVFNPPPGGGASNPMMLPIAEIAGPVITSAGLVNGASFGRVAPAVGSIASLFGSNLASSTVKAGSLPLPTTLGGVTLRLNSVAAPLFFVSPGQINFQIPWELLGQTQASLTVSKDGVTTIPVTVDLAFFSPGLFSTSKDGTGQGAILDAQGRLVDASNPARAGEVVQMFCTGLGATNPRVTSGQPGPAAEPLARVAVPVEARVGGRAATVHFAGLAPGFVGLYQVNVEIPAGVELGPAVSLVLLQNGIPSNFVTLALRP